MAKPDVRSVLIEQIATIPDQTVGAFLSGGIDSICTIFAAIELGKKITAYTFHMEGTYSTDLARAKRMSSMFNLKHVTITLPQSIDELKTDLVVLRDLGAIKKTDYECAWPFLKSYPAVAERYVLNGLGADGHFCISKKWMIHFRKTRIDEFRRALYENPKYAQRHLHELIARPLGKIPVYPFMTEAMRQQFLGTTWHEVNQPKQKQPIIDAFPKNFSRIASAIRILPHENLQNGDSGISKHFRRLLETDWNINGHKSIVGIYNDLNHRRIP